MYYFQPSHTSFFSPHILDNFTSIITYILDIITNIYFVLHKFSLEKLASLPTCNASKIVHNVWLQQSRKRGACLYVVTLDDYVQIFIQSTLYSHFK